MTVPMPFPLPLPLPLIIPPVPPRPALPQVPVSFTTRMPMLTLSSMATATVALMLPPNPTLSPAVVPVRLSHIGIILAGPGSFRCRPCFGHMLGRRLGSEGSELGHSTLAFFRARPHPPVVVLPRLHHVHCHEDG